jgi:hypothetical protein
MLSSCVSPLLPITNSTSLCTPVPQIAFVGFAVQALVTRTQPIEGLTKHLSDPFGKNITYYVTHLPEVLAGTA